MIWLDLVEEKRRDERKMGGEGSLLEVSWKNLEGFGWGSCVRYDMMGVEMEMGRFLCNGIEYCTTAFYGGWNACILHMDIGGRLY